MDRLVWAYTPKGTFSVNSAYKVALSLTLATNSESTSHGQDKSSFWHTIWGPNIPNKIKTFTWKACRDTLPTKTDHCRRWVLEDANCDAFNLAAESSSPLFWDCTRAREIWTLSGISFDDKGIHYRDFMYLLWHLIYFQHVGTKLLELIVTIAWCIWYDRNKTRLGSPRQPSWEILHEACMILEEFQLSHLRQPQLRQAQDMRWVPPKPPFYKTYIDATIFDKSVGLGAVIRNHEGAVIAALSNHL